MAESIPTSSFKLVVLVISLFQYVSDQVAKCISKDMKNFIWFRARKHMQNFICFRTLQIRWIQSKHKSRKFIHINTHALK
jgi:hypothetical protein